MKRLLAVVAVVVSTFLLVGAVSAGIVYESEPNDTYEQANALAVGDTIMASFSASDSVDYFAIQMESTKMYYITSNGDVDVNAFLYAASDPNTNILTGDVDNRGIGDNFRISGYVPAESGTYYLKVISKGNTGDYSVRFVGGRDLAVIGALHEPDNSMAEADAQPELPTDGTVLAGCIYPKDDSDFYKIEGIGGRKITIDVSPLPDMEIRDTDTVVELWDAAGNVLADNDDKKSGITFSTIRKFELPADGTYYVLVRCYYHGDRVDDKHPGTGEYGVRAFYAGVETEPNDTWQQATELSFGDTLSAHFTADTDTVDWFVAELDSTRMYYIGSVGDSVEPHVEFYYYDPDGDSLVSLLDSKVDGRGEGPNFRIAGFVPEETGKYYLRLSDPDNVTAGYGMRITGGHSVPYWSQVHEPDNTRQEAANSPLVDTTGVPVRGMLYPVDDVDYYRFEANEGDSYLIETQPLDSMGIRDTDTDMYIFDENGVLKGHNDDGRYGTFSTLQWGATATGVYYVRVSSYYCAPVNGNTASFRNPGTGEYKLIIKRLGKVAPDTTEDNNTPETAFRLQLGQMVRATLTATDSVDYFLVHMSPDKMYYIDSFGNTNPHVHLYYADAPGVNILDGDIRGRGYGGTNFRLAGYVPLDEADYLVKVFSKGEVGEYWIRWSGGRDLDVIANKHEPDNSGAEAQQQDSLDVSGNPYASCIYPYNDLDLYIFYGEEGQQPHIWTEPLPDMNSRDTDTRIYLWSFDYVMGLAEGQYPLLDSTIAENDDDPDKGPENGNTVFSELDARNCPPLPYTGLYFLGVSDYYNTINTSEPPSSLDRNPGTGEYQLLATLGATAVEMAKTDLPTVYALRQNYPNPFNPTTTIEYDLPEPTHVSLRIFDMRGRLVKELVNGKQAPGSYRLKWDGTNQAGEKVASGVYLYMLKAGNYVRIHKMMLVK